MSGVEGNKDVAESGGESFLDSSPSDTFAKLGRPEEVPPAPSPPSPAPAPVEAPETAPAGPAGVMTATGVASAAGGGLGLDWDQPGTQSPQNAVPAAVPVAEPAVEPAIEPAVEPAVEPTVVADEPGPAAGEPGPLIDESEATGELPVIAATVFEPASAQAEPTPPDARGAQAEGEPEASDDLVPLSSIIVTTSTKMVDLRDPEVRRMLTELVTFEIDQATQFRKSGQSIDAVLQLTEAEKICRALGKHDTAREIRDMMRELKD
jgi:hypothetical protein